MTITKLRSLGMNRCPRMIAAILVATAVAATQTEAVAEIPAAQAPAASTSEDTKPLLRYAEPPPLDQRIIEMMKTNTTGVVEARIHFVEKWEITPVQKGQVFFSMLANADADNQRKLAHAAVKYVPNTNYLLIRKHLLDPQLPRLVLSVFMTDTLKRPNAVKMPTLLALAQVDAQPMQNEARELLRAYLGRDYGTNWVKWEDSMRAWLKDNPR